MKYGWEYPEPGGGGGRGAAGAAGGVERRSAGGTTGAGLTGGGAVVGDPISDVLQTHEIPKNTADDTAKR